LRPHSTRRFRHALLAASLITIATVPRLAAQQLDNHLYDKFQAMGSLSLLVLSTNIQIDPSNGEGTEISVESILGLPSTTWQPRAALRFRMGRRNELEAAYQWASRTGDVTLADSIVVGDTTFPAGASIQSKLNTSQLTATYRFAFTAKERTQIGVGLGLGAIFLNESIDALASVGTNSVSYSQAESFPGPTASLGLYGRFRAGDSWYFEADARGIYAKVSNVKAGIIELGGDVRYFFNKTIGASLGYGLGFYKVTLSRDGTLVDLSGSFKYTIQGFRAGLVVAF
jgi:hypothetical protein